MIPAKQKSLFWTFAGAIFLVLLGVGLVQWLVVSVVLHRVHDRHWAERAARIAEEVVAEIPVTLTESGQPTPRTRRLLAGRLRPGGGFLVLEYAPQIGEAMTVPGLRRGPPFRRRPPDDQHPPPGRRPLRRLQRLLSLEVVQNGEGVGTLTVYRPEPRLARGLVPPADVSRRLLVSLPIALILSGLAGLWLLRTLLRRLRNLDALAERVTAGDLEATIEDTRGDELSDLAAKFNQMTRSLRQARQRLEGKNVERRALLADLSHELATPLTSIRGAAETLLNPAVTLAAADRERTLAGIVEESERMGVLVEELLELSRMESGAAELERSRLDWAALAGHTVERFQARFGEHGLGLDSVEPAEPAWVLADGFRLERALENLLVNALRYVPAGGRVRVRLTSAVGWHTLHVEDNGPGFAEEDLEHAFDRFFRGHRARAAGGSGLGLAIVEEIVRQHGGQALAANLPDGGATLQLRLPAAD